MKRNTKGFTIVELLIVIVVIGILAAITIVAYNGIQNRANDTAVQNDLTNFAKRAKAFHAIEGRYPTPSQFFTSSLTVEMNVSKASYALDVYNLYYCVDKDTGDRFGIAARSKSRQTFTISSTNGIQTTAAVPSWGVSCGAFGETNLDNITFSYGYHLGNETWQFGL